MIIIILIAIITTLMMMAMMLMTVIMKMIIVIIKMRERERNDVRIKDSKHNLYLFIIWENISASLQARECYAKSIGLCVESITWAINKICIVD